ncbi:MAG: ABC transporter ATP-binding protein [Dongiaceae bacterium]
MDIVAFSEVTKTYRGVKALDALTLSVRADALTVLCGPPQSGKSVLMRLLVGLEKAESGRILVEGQDVTALPPGARHIGYVPQSFALYPHLTVFENIAYPMRLQSAPKAEIARKVERAVQLLSIGHLLQKRPEQLSGGEKQRVAIARGLLKDARIFVLDDPLVGLDYKLRERLMDDLQSMRRELGATFLYATSDALEAMTMAEDIVVMDAGKVVEHAPVARLYQQPHHLRSMELVGFPSCNMLQGEMAGNGICHSLLGSVALDAEAELPQRGARIVLGLRPEAITLTAAGPGTSLGNGTGTVRLVEDLGGEQVVYLDTAGLTLVTCLSVGQGTVPAYGEEIAYRFDPASLIAFDAGSGRRLGRGKEIVHA